MKKVFLSALRDIYTHKSRTLVIFLAMTMVTTFPIAFMDLPYNLSNIIHDEQTNYKLAHINVFFTHPANQTEINELKQVVSTYMNDKTNTIEFDQRLHYPSKYRSAGNGDIPKGEWVALDIIAQKGLPKINQIDILNGRYPNRDNEIAILDSLAKKDNLTVNDQIAIYGKQGPINYTIVGLISAIEYSSFDISQTGAVYLTINGISKLLNENVENKFNSIPMYFGENVNLTVLRGLSDHIYEKFNSDPNNPQIAVTWFSRETSFRRALQDALELTSRYMYIASIFIFIVAGVIIYVVMNRYVTEQKTILGALYAFGVNKFDIVLSYFLRVFVIGLFAIPSGLLLAKFIIYNIIVQLAPKWGLLTVENNLSTLSMFFTLTSGAMVAYIFTSIAVYNLLRLTPYEAMRGKNRDLKNRGFIYWFGSFIPNKTIRNSLKNLTRNRTRTFLTVIALTMALTFSLSLTYTNESLTYTVNDFFDNNVSFDLNVDIGFENAMNINLINDIINLDGVKSVEPNIHTLVQIVNQPEKLVFLQSYIYNSTMVKLDKNTIFEGQWFTENSSEVVISQYVHGTLGFNINDTISYRILGREIHGVIVGIANDFIGSSSIMVDLEYLSYQLSDLYQLPPEYEQYGVGVVMNSIFIRTYKSSQIKEIQDKINREYPEIEIAQSKSFYHNRMLSITTSQSIIIVLMVSLGYIVGIISVFTTLLIAVIEREHELALLQVFGYSKLNLFIQILLEGLLLAIIALFPTYPISRIITYHLWMPIVNNKLFIMKAYYSIDVELFLFYFTLFSVSISIIPAFILATKRKIAEILREE